MKALIVFFIFVLSTSFALAHNWIRHEIPGAFCGNGEPYSVFVELRNPAKLLVEFQGGGACWSERTCYGRTALVTLSAPKEDPKDNLLIRTTANNPWAQHSKIYFPYCTADVFAGFHQAQYTPGVTLYHFGYQNVVEALHYLNTHQILSFPAVTDLVVWGASAGGIAAFVHADNVQMMVPGAQRKTLLSDSPGLHFGNGFWRKFSPQMNQNFKDSFGKMGLVYDLNDGLIAAHMGPVFVKLWDWRVGVLQSTKDTAMSLLYGGVTPQQHRQMVLGPSGLPAVARAYPHVLTWIADVSTHTFLLRDSSAETRSMQGETATAFSLRFQ